MEDFYKDIDSNFESILSGDCLTTYRNENSKIAKKYDQFNPEDLVKISETKFDFLIYLANYLFLKGYQIIGRDPINSSIVSTYNSVEYEFLLDFDYSDNPEEIKIKVLDKGLKEGISGYDCKYVFIISLQKMKIFLLNCDTLKKQIKENRANFNILTENDALFKTQFISFSASSLNQKIRSFLIK